MLLQTTSLAVAYGGVRATDGVSLGVEEGSLVGLIGPDGAGKTTFIDAVCGFVPYQGTVTLMGRMLDGLPPTEGPGWDWRETVLDCLRVALQAPTGGNSQRWRWVVVDDPDIRAGLADLYRRSHDPYLAEQRAARGPVSGPMERVLDSSSYLSAHLHEVPVHVVPCWLDRLPPGAGTDEMAGIFGSILPAVWSFMLALRSRGLGSAWTTLHLAYEREAGELLGIPDTVTQVALIPVAHYTGTDFRPAERKRAEDVTYWNGWRRQS